MPTEIASRGVERIDVAVDRRRPHRPRVGARDRRARAVGVRARTTTRGRGSRRSTHNSGVIHAGIYYPAGTLKAEALGRRRAPDVCGSAPRMTCTHRRCGKIIVARDATRDAGARGAAEARATATASRDSRSSIARSSPGANRTCTVLAHSFHRIPASSMPRRS